MFKVFLDLLNTFFQLFSNTRFLELFKLQQVLCHILIFFEISTLLLLRSFDNLEGFPTIEEQPGVQSYEATCLHATLFSLIPWV